MSTKLLIFCKESKAPKLVPPKVFGQAIKFFQVLVNTNRKSVRAVSLKGSPSRSEATRGKEGYGLALYGSKLIHDKILYSQYIPLNFMATAKRFRAAM